MFFNDEDDEDEILYYDDSSLEEGLDLEDHGYDSEDYVDYVDHGYDSEDSYEDSTQALTLQVQETNTNLQEGTSSHGYAAQIPRLLPRFYNILKVKTLRMKVNTKWTLIKWLFLMLNVLIEVFQATLTQVNEQGEISTPFYLKMSIVTSSCCLVMSLVEIIGEGRNAKWCGERGAVVAGFTTLGDRGEFLESSHSILASLARQSKS